MTKPELATGSEPTPDAVGTTLLDQWATDANGPVALYMKQKLLPVETVEAHEGNQGIIYPPTYADIGYNIDTLSDGKKVALIDSVGSQANRMEPIFKSSEKERKKWLVPQIDIVLHAEKQKQQKGAETEEQHKEKRSLLDLAHRSADAVVQSSPTLRSAFEPAFEALRRTGDASLLCCLAPTSLVFGVWDSRGGSGEKRPRLVRSIIRAWDVDVLHAAAQFNSVWKALSEDQQDVLTKEAKAKKVKLSEKGFADAPAVFKTKTKLPKYIDGAPNPEARVLGGIFVRDRIEREVTVNLLALRNIRGKNDEETKKIRRYLLGLALVAATTQIDLFLREGCHLRYQDKADVWYTVLRRGSPTTVDLGSDAARATLLQYALEAAQPFRESWPETLEHQFNLAEAKKLLAKKDEDEPSEE